VGLRVYVRILGIDPENWDWCMDKELFDRPGLIFYRMYYSGEIKIFNSPVAAPYTKLCNMVQMGFVRTVISRLPAFCQGVVYRLPLKHSPKARERSF